VRVSVHAECEDRADPDRRECVRRRPVSPGETPDAASVYTHKLNFELDTAFLPFSRLSEDNWLRHLEVEGSLDYVATGLPKAGDVIGNQRYRDDASRWSFSFVGVIPLAPLAP
jgi:hypothetical protein